MHEETGNLDCLLWTASAFACSELHIILQFPSLCLSWALNAISKSSLRPASSAKPSAFPSPHWLSSLSKQTIYNLALNYFPIVSQVLVLSSHLDLEASEQQGLCLNLRLVTQRGGYCLCGSHIRGLYETGTGKHLSFRDLMEDLDLPSAFLSTKLRVK